MRTTAVIVAAAIGAAVAQDPAQGWLGYAKGVSPTGGRLTRVRCAQRLVQLCAASQSASSYLPLSPPQMEAKWVVGSNPTRQGAFYSPWFGEPH